MVGYVYITYNQINSKFYVGIHKRKTFTDTYKGSGIIIKKAIKKYGNENFITKLVQECETLDELNKLEIYWIAEFKRIYGEDNCYNIQLGGNIPTNKGIRLSEEQKQKLRDRSWKAKGLQNPMTGHKHTKETKQLQHELKQGVYNGVNNPNYGIKRKHIWKDDIHKYVKVDELEYYMKLGYVLGPSCNKSKKGMKGKKLSEETKQKISNSQKQRLNKI